MIDPAKIKEAFTADIAEADTAEKVENIRVKYLGRKQGMLQDAFSLLPELSDEDKKKTGPQLQEIKSYISKHLDEKLHQFSETDTGNIDLTVPPEAPAWGHIHPLTQTQHDLEQIFSALGFRVEYGPEIESDWYNFTALNFPEDHPARDMQDTFYIKHPGKEKLVMRTHTSPMQVRFMQQHKPPFAVVVPGKVYRNEATDATHEHTFDQIEGLVVGSSISFANMVWTINAMFKAFFGSDVKTKVLPTYFPFVEPGAEYALSSPKFKNGKWIEMGGCGMVHQNVFEAAGYPKNKYQGFAFGFGSTRFPLMKNGIPDIRLLHENNLEFLNQF